MSEAAERYRRAKAIFLLALERSLQERADFVSTACGDDAELRLAVEALLADERTRGGAHEPLDALDRLDHAPLLPKLPPDYRIVRELGRGGMGVVWLAERDSGDFKQRVALKLLGFDALRDPDRRARFRAERRILASLEHPHIARLIDGGTLADGTPFLAMEFVDGERLDAWAERARPLLRDLLKLFVAICRAVQAAHQRLIVHRDLKPANILVDGYGAPKLLDFGIAKLLDDSVEVEVATGTGMQLLTPRYAAPEQVRGETITTATDVYALGVILYELLTGASPYGRAAATPDQLRAICDTEPVRPSQATRGDGVTGTTSAAHLRGDLDAILLKCLRKEAPKRYRGAAELADDLEAFLDGRPVAARAGSTRYAMAKFVARHRVLVASMLVVFGLLVGFSLLLAAQLQETRRERDSASRERDRSRRVAEYLVEVLDRADPAQTRGKDVTIGEALRQAEPQFEERFQRYPDTRAYLYRRLAQIHLKLGDAPHALELVQRAVALAEAHPEITAIERIGAWKLRGDALSSTGDVEAAERDYRRALDAAVALESGEAQLEAMLALAGLAQQRNQAEVALDWQRRARKQIFQQLGVTDLKGALALKINPARRPFLESLAHLSQTECGALADARRTAEARTVCEQTLALKLALWPADHPIHLTTRGTLATLAAVSGEDAEALRLRRGLFEDAVRIYGATDTRTAFAQFNLGVSLAEDGQRRDAESMYRGALDILRGTLGPAHRATLVVAGNLANLMLDSERPEEAEALAVEVLAQRRKSLGDGHPDVALALVNLSRVELALGKHVDATIHVTEAIAIYRDQPTPSQYGVASGTAILAQVRLAAGNWEDAAAQAEAALRLYQDIPDEPGERVRSRFWLAQAQWALGRHETALENARLALGDVLDESSANALRAEIEGWIAERSHR